MDGDDAGNRVVAQKLLSRLKSVPGAVDLRIQQQIKLGGRARLALTGEIFNVFNHDNFGSFVTIINNASFGQPRQNLGNAYVPRSGQLGFRFSF